MVEVTHLVAVVLALGAAVAVASHHIFVRMGTDEGDPLHAVLVVMIINTLVLLPVVVIGYYPAYGLTVRSWLSFIAAGILGSLLGRALLYTSIERIGASRTVPIIASWGLPSTVLGVVILGEALTPVHGVGVVLVVGGATIIAWETGRENPTNLSRRELAIGLALPFAAALAFGSEPIFASFGFAEGTPAVVGLGVKTLAATLGFVLYLWYRGAIPATSAVRSVEMQWFVLAGIANTLFLLGYYLALEIAPVIVVVPVVVSNPLFVVLLSALFVPDRLETVTWQIAVAALFVVTGVVTVAVYG